MSNDVKLELLTEWRRDEVQAIGAAISIRCWHSLERAYNALRDKMDRVIHAPPTARHQPQRDAILEEAARFVEQRVGDTFLLAEELRALKTIPAAVSTDEIVATLDERIASTEADVIADREDAETTGERPDLYHYTVELTLDEARTILSRLRGGGTNCQEPDEAILQDIFEKMAEVVAPLPGEGEE